VDKTLEDLSQAIQNIGIDPNFPRILGAEHMKEIRIATLDLSAAVMDCLTELISFVVQSSELCLGLLS